MNMNRRPRSASANRGRGFIMALAAFICLIATGTAIGTAEAQSAVELFRTANQAYESRQFDEAVKLYSQIDAKGIHDPAVFYNLGNAYLKVGDIAHAILFYERALRLKPRDRDIQQNLDMARTMITDRIDSTDASIMTAFFRGIYRTFSINEWTIIVAALFQLICILILIRMLVGVGHPLIRELAAYTIIISLVLLIAAGTFFTIKLSAHNANADAIVMIADVTVRSGPADSYTALVKIHKGLKVSIKQARPDSTWCQIRLANGYEGWIPLTSVERI